MTSPLVPASSQLPGVAAGVSSDTSRVATSGNLDKAGQRFEAIFINMMLKSMRQAKLGEGLFDSNASEQFRDMQDQRLAETMATHAPIGIGKAMVDFLGKSQPVPIEPPAPPAEGGAG